MRSLATVTATRLVYEQTPEEFQFETHKAKAILEDVIGFPVFSYRAASYSITKESMWALQILAEEGFKYDSSIFPIAHDRYGIPNAARHPFRAKLSDGMELIEFPLSTIKILGMNIPIAGGGYFRLFPYVFTRAAIRHLNQKDKLPLIFYLHPGSLTPNSRLKRLKGYPVFAIISTFIKQNPGSTNS